MLLCLCMCAHVPMYLLSLGLDLCAHLECQCRLLLSWSSLCAIPRPKTTNPEPFRTHWATTLLPMKQTARANEIAERSRVGKAEETPFFFHFPFFLSWSMRCDALLGPVLSFFLSHLSTTPMHHLEYLFHVSLAQKKII